MKTEYSAITVYNEYSVCPDDLNFVNTEKYRFVINSVTGGWAQISDEELAFLTFGNTFYDEKIGEIAYQSGIAMRNGVYVFNQNMTKSSIDKVYVFEFRVTDMCNLNCIYCSSEACNTEGEKPSLEIGHLWIDRVCEYIVQQKLKHVSLEFTGGEPLLYLEFLEQVIEYAKTSFSDYPLLEVNYTICTNGSLIEDKHIEFLKKIDNRGIQVSLDGMKEINDFQRPYHSGKSSYEKVVDNIKKLRANGISVDTIASVITRFSTEHIPDIAKLILELECEKMTLQPMCQVGRATMEDELILNAQTYVDNIFEAVDNVVLPHWKKNGRRVFIRNLSITYAYLLKPYRKYMCQRCPCGSGTNIVSTDYKGDVYGCNTGPFDETTLYGNIRRNSLQECLSSTNALAFQTRDINKIEECKNCAFRVFCQGGCPKSALSVYGNINRPGDICAINKRLIVKAMESLVEEKYPKDFVRGLAKSFLFDDVETI